MEVNLHPALLSSVPPEVAGINVNFCKNPLCPNFGVPAEIVKFRRKKGSSLAAMPGTAYGFSSFTSNRPSLICMLCKEKFGIKSNQAVAEELTRFSRYLAPMPPVCCPNPECANHSVPIETTEAYYRFGQTKAGTPRYQCRLCKKTMSAGGKALKKQRITHQNKTILLALTNKMPLRRIAKITGINAVTLYSKIDFIHRQCLAFSASRESALKELARPRLYK